MTSLFQKRRSASSPPARSPPPPLRPKPSAIATRDRGNGGAVIAAGIAGLAIGRGALERPPLRL
ncbi:MAG: hypothetical protein WDN24_07135 [Sphingomonas sp.]